LKLTEFGPGNDRICASARDCDVRLRSWSSDSRDGARSPL